jgi:hypothetical protein
MLIAQWRKNASADVRILGVLNVWSACERIKEETMDNNRSFDEQLADQHLTHIVKGMSAEKFKICWSGE